MQTYGLSKDDYRQLVAECIYLLKGWYYGQGMVVTRQEGICHNIWRMTSFNAPTPFKDRLMHLMTQWDDFSGDDLFPVPPVEGMVSEDPMDAYLCVSDEWRGEYGKKRRELCLYLAGRLEEELKCK